MAVDYVEGTSAVTEVLDGSDGSNRGARDFSHRVERGSLFLKLGDEPVNLSPGILNHSRVSSNLATFLRNNIICPKYEVFDEKLLWARGDKLHYYIPDVAVVCNNTEDIAANAITADIVDTADTVEFSGDDYLYEGVPKFIAEVLSPSTRLKDRGEKFYYIEERGVPEYWIISIESRTVEIYRNINGRLILQDIYTYYTQKEFERVLEIDKQGYRDSIPISFLPNVSLKLEELFYRVVL